MISLQDFLANVRIADAFDIFTASVVIYFVLRWLKKRASHAAAAAVMAIAVVYLAARLVGMYLTLAVLQAGLGVILLSLVVIFQQDIRQAFEHLSAWRPFSGRDAFAPTHPLLDTLVEAASVLAEESTGALIVLKGRQPLDRHIRGGIPADATTTIPLLHSIFNAQSQGHDGAVIITNQRIHTFGAHLPLSTNLQKTAGAGTRHAAALGLAERTDAVVNVVSEERGSISVGQNNDLIPMENAAQLKDVLRRAFQLRQLRSAKRQRRTWFSSLEGVGLQAAALAIATVLWFLFAFQIETVQRTVADVPVEFRNLPDQWQIESLEPAAVNLTLTGPERAFAAFDPQQLRITLTLKQLTEKEIEIPIAAEQLELPPDIALRSIDAPSVRLQLREYRRVELPVHVATREELPPGRSLVSLRANPATVAAMVPSSLPTIEKLNTEPIDLSTVNATTTRQIKLLPPDKVRLQTSDTNITVTITVQTNSSEEPPKPPQKENNSGT